MKYLIGICQLALCIFVILNPCSSVDEVCDRRPLGTETDPLPPDNQFVLDIDEIRDKKYIPKREYKVRLHSRDEKSTFTAFTISLREDSIVNKNNIRRQTYLKAGSLEPWPGSMDVRIHPYCNNTIKESDIVPKTLVEGKWTAPEKGNQCVTIFAVVAVNSIVWYSFEGPLSKRVCEDPRKDDDMPPMENDNCQVCDDARYALTFEGLWSYNTHPTMFPSLYPHSKDLARFSDIVGASHNNDFSLYKYNSIATLGLKMLAEQGNTTQMEIEIEAYLGTKVRTIIKANAPPKPNMNTMTTFRVSRDFHRVSLVTAILPSPDWFLGVSNMELCHFKSGHWSEMIRLNLYPMDAGTDKGLDFESANEETSPYQPVALAKIGITGDDVRKDKRPFARLHLKLVRTYSTPRCTTSETVDENEVDEGEGDDNVVDNDEGNEGDDGDEGDVDDNEGEQEPSNVNNRPTTSEEPPKDPDSSEKCPMTQWAEWLPCEGECIDNKLEGFKIRFRYHMVDGVAVGQYGDGSSGDEKKVSEYCFDNYPDSETKECEEPCEEEAEEDAEAERRIWDNSNTWWK